MKHLFLFSIVLLILGCSPKIMVTSNPSIPAYPATLIYQSFGIIESDSIRIDDYEFLATIQIKEKGFTVNCDYQTVKRLAVSKARELGGNCLRITEHKTPDKTSTCHRIKADVLRISNPEKFETEITWHPQRTLKIENFKGSTSKRPFQAATYSMIQYYAKHSPITGKAKAYVESVFNADLSYFKRSTHDEYILKHEQLHFDITEIYARKFRKSIIEKKMTFVQFSDQHISMFNKIQEELRLKQDEYDSEVYSDSSLQPKWNDWVKEELKKYEEYSDTEIIFGKK